MGAPRTAILGGAIGAAAAIAGLALWPSAPVHLRWEVSPVSGPPLAEDRGALETVAFHFVPEMQPIAEAVYRDFLPALDPATRLVAVVPDEPGAREALTRFLLSLPGGEGILQRTVIAPAKGPISVWSKDRSLVASAAGGMTTLLVPARPDGASERRLLDWKTPAAIADALPARFQAFTLPLDFDAGDFAVAGERVIVDVNLFAKNRGRAIESPRQLADGLSRLLSREVVLLGSAEGDVPRHHLSMYLAPLEGNVVLVGDPSAGLPVVGEGFRPGEKSPDSGAPLLPDFGPETQRRFDRAARDLTAAGFRVVRIPTVAFDDKTYFAYTNGVFETRAGRRIAYVPVYGVPRLDEAALAVYRNLGWEVRPVAARAAFPFHGTLGCLVNVLGRGPATSSPPSP